jgi:ComF family protein
LDSPVAGVVPDLHALAPGADLAVRQARRLPASEQAWDAVIGAVDYALPWDRWVQRLKYEAGLELADAMATLCAHAWHRLADDPGHGRDDDQTDPVVVPVPLADHRLRTRGYNQAWELARRMARQLGLSAHADALLRLKDTRSQAELGRLDRRVNLGQAFAANPRALDDIVGRTILLVDDVLTTGATADAACRALRQAGAARIDVCVFAVTPAPGDPHLASSDVSRSD